MLVSEEVPSTSGSAIIKGLDDFLLKLWCPGMQATVIPSIRHIIQCHLMSLTASFFVTHLTFLHSTIKFDDLIWKIIATHEVFAVQYGTMLQNWGAQYTYPNRSASVIVNTGQYLGHPLCPYILQAVNFYCRKPYSLLSDADFEGPLWFFLMLSQASVDLHARDHRRGCHYNSCPGTSDIPGHVHGVQGRKQFAADTQGLRALWWINSWVFPFLNFKAVCVPCSAHTYLIHFYPLLGPFVWEILTQVEPPIKIWD